MKKLFLLFIAFVFVNSLKAQNANNSVVLEEKSKHRVKDMSSSYTVSKEQSDEAINKFRPSNQQNNTGNKTTSVGLGRWYTHWMWEDSLAGIVTVSTSLFPIWFDSTVKQNNGTAAVTTVKYCAVGEVTDPIHFNFFGYDPKHYYDSNAIVVSMADNYTVDSVSIMAAYVKNPGRPVSIVDTLIFSAVVNTSHITYLDSSSMIGIDTIYMPQIHNVDTVYNAAFNDAAGSTTQILWKQPLTDAMRHLPVVSGNDTITNFTFPVGGTLSPNPLHVPAGANYAITCTFRSGDTWSINADNLEQYHHFMVVADEPNGSGTQMPYHWFDDSDYNMSQLLFADSNSHWFPTNQLERSIFGAQFSQEFFRISTFINCTTCAVLQPRVTGIANTTPAISIDGVYPNPATNNVTISFILPADQNVSVTIENILGQTLKKLDMGYINNGKAVFYTNDLANGVYFYTVRSDTDKTTGRMVVAH
ncbi:MAG: T9SS type A sorting domain-containing protein [Bacteroidota bacterium]